MFPPNGAQLELASDGSKPDPVALKIAGGVEPLTVLVNGVPLVAQPGKRTLFFEPGVTALTITNAVNGDTFDWAKVRNFQGNPPTSADIAAILTK